MARIVNVSGSSDPPGEAGGRRILQSDSGGAAPPSEVPAWRRAGAPTDAEGTAGGAGGQAPAPSLREQVSADRLAQAESELRKRMNTARGELDQLLAIVPQLSDAAVREAAANRAQVIAEVQKRRQQAAANARTAAEAAAQVALATVDLTLHEAASGAASAPWADLTCSPSADVPPLIRFGQLALDDETVPALAPLLNEAGWYLSGDRGAAEDLVVSLITRLLAMVPVRHLRVEVFDPRLRGVMGRFATLRNSFGGNFPQPTSDNSAFATRLAQLMESAGSNVELATAAGAATLTDHWAKAGVPEGQLNLCVVLDYPFAVDARLHDQLLRTASIGGPSGTTVVVVEDPSTPPASDVDPGALQRLLRPFSYAAGRWGTPDLPVPARTDPAPTAAVVSAVLAGALEAAKSLQGPVIPLTNMIAADLAQPWTGSSAESLDVVIGREKALPLTLSLRTENPPHPNVLVGGAVGQGKSNLLLDIVYSLASRYRPDELELHLLDFKRGLEFKRFAEDDEGRNWLPHAKVLCLESSPAFGVAVLRNMEQEMERRSQLFKAAGVASLNAYRADPNRTLPRIVLIIDEFHVLFEGADHEVEAAVSYLTKLAKQGRAYGIHLLLASQTISGVGALSVKGDAIFAQFPLRLSLKNTADESQAILSRGNKAAADLTYRGELVLNRNFGHDPSGSNVRGVAAYADPDAMKDLQNRLWRLGHGEPPLMFLGSSYADYRNLAAEPVPPGDERLPLRVGRPIAVGNDARTLMLTPDVDQGVAVVGQDPELAVAVLRSMVFSAAPVLASRSGRIVVLQGGDESAVGPVREAAARAAEAGVEVEFIPRTEIAGFIRDRLAPRLRTDGEPWLVVGVGLQRVRGMADRDPADDDDFGFSLGGSDDNTPRGILSRTATEGALAGVHLVGWWPNLRALRTDVAQGSGIGAYLTTGLGGEDLKDLVGGLAPAIDGWPRLGLYDLAGQGRLEVLVPFDPASTPIETSPASKDAR